ncbi:Riboflavin biosynthesis protein RibD [Kingella potus]|uniref:Riboflavin biosynthesis protein RibD n=1 Tax=Kingella potus TaxID=265175 RepID=A0A377R317_9NEIS|nr:bifunctional diaminohydroxyphosphoribosylaminopyrimidine deaminase/5-amino-6-(5-phosphoribosylamino)uracil reductase RibD [Kingella potus]STR02901.1 Riboflavin biosynthesis protein RibD [Kingella potus]
MSCQPPPAFSDTDRRHMRTALALAREGRFSASPNPRVGCVIARGEQIVGMGFHVRAGEPHAEVHALRQAGELARGATAYVTLEPCAHYGRTPPCAQALIAAGVSRVAAAISDPNPQVAGKGLAMLEAAGIRTGCGLLAAEARELNRGFLSRIERGRPFVRLKCAASLDGKTALSDGRSQWITDEAARADVQLLRAESCAVLSGIGTVLADDPLLTVRAFPVVRPPVRVILDSRLRLNPSAKMLADASAPLMVLTGETDPAKHSAFARFPHASVHAVPLRSDGLTDLPAALALLAQHGIGEVLAEAGATLAGALLHADLADEIVLYQAAKILGTPARGLFALPEDAAALHDAPRWETRSVEMLGNGVKWVLRRTEAV